MRRVLIGSSVRQDPRILECFLDSLRDLNTSNLNVDYMFIDDNDDAKASQLLQNFRPLRSRVTMVQADDKREPYVKDQITHRWNEKLVWRVAHNKNLIINHCLSENYDYLLLVDSDQVLHPETLIRLIATSKNIIAEIIWTKFMPDTIEMPNVWFWEQYTIYRRDRGEQVSAEERDRRMLEFLNMLRKPGVYRVGGLAACTLFSQKALKSGVSYKEIYNLPFMGEDRHMCIRAAALGFELFVDTYFPAYHIYRERNLEEVPRYLESFYKMSIDTYSQVIISTLKETLEKPGIDFRDTINKTGCRNNFTDRGWEAFASWRGKEMVLLDKSILRAEIRDISVLDFNEDLDACDVTLDLNLTGSKYGKRFEKAEEVQVEMKMLNTGDWKIDYYEVPDPRLEK